MKTETKQFRIYKINDCDWWMATSLEDAVKGALSQHEDAIIEDPAELTDADMDTLQFWDDENRDEADMSHWQCECGAMADVNCRWNGRAYEHHHGYPIGHVEMNNIHRRSFREEMERIIASGGGRNRFFASTEY